MVDSNYDYGAVQMNRGYNATSSVYVELRRNYRNAFNGFSSSVIVFPIFYPIPALFIALSTH